MSVRFLTFVLYCLEEHFCMSHRNVSRLDYLYVCLAHSVLLLFFFPLVFLAELPAWGVALAVLSSLLLLCIIIIATYCIVRRRLVYFKFSFLLSLSLSFCGRQTKKKETKRKNKKTKLMWVENRDVID